MTAPGTCTFATQAGNCNATNSVPFTVAGTRVSSAGGGKVTGGISRGGSVSVRISVGASWANGSGRLAGNSGAGRWSGIITGDRCSGSLAGHAELSTALKENGPPDDLAGRVPKFTNAQNSQTRMADANQRGARTITT